MMKYKLIIAFLLLSFFSIGQDESSKLRSGVGIVLDGSIGVEYRRSLGPKLELRAQGFYGKLTNDYRSAAKIGLVKYFREEKRRPGFFKRFRPYFAVDLEYESFEMERFGLSDYESIQANFSLGTDVRITNRFNLFTELKMGSLKLHDTRYDVSNIRNFEYFGGAALGLRYRF